MTTTYTFSIRNNPANIESAITQAVAALVDMGCSSTIRRYKKSIRVTANQPILNTLTGEYSKPSFKLVLVADKIGTP